MRQIKILLILLTLLFGSCYKAYDVRVGSSEKVLVVDGLVTDQPDVYHVKLSYAGPFNSKESFTPVSSASVRVTDDLANSYIFRENAAGDYKSDSLEFTGKPGRSYSVHIMTAEGDEYQSDPQRLFPGSAPDSIYAESGTKLELDNATGLKMIKYGAIILGDIDNLSDTFPRFRFTSNLVRQYSYGVYPRIGDATLNFDFYCWETVNANSDINLTNEAYSLNSASVKRHPVCFLDDDVYFYSMLYGLDMNMADTTAITIKFNYQEFFIEKRILYLNMYTLNNETYNYYRKMDEQMQSKEKLFDPIAVQIKGNIRCISDPEKKVIGFFETSSVVNTEYIAVFGDVDHPYPALIKTPYILPPGPAGCRINRYGSPHQGHNIPAFWIFNVSK